MTVEVVDGSVAPGEAGFDLLSAPVVDARKSPLAKWRRVLECVTFARDQFPCFKTYGVEAEGAIAEEEMQRALAEACHLLAVLDGLVAQSLAQSDLASHIELAPDGRRLIEVVIEAIKYLQANRPEPAIVARACVAAGPVNGGRRRRKSKD
jgi:hypothetical protein